MKMEGKKEQAWERFNIPVESLLETVVGLMDSAEKTISIRTLDLCYPLFGSNPFLSALERAVERDVHTNIVTGPYVVFPSDGHHRQHPIIIQFTPPCEPYFFRLVNLFVHEDTPRAEYILVDGQAALIQIRTPTQKEETPLCRYARYIPTEDKSTEDKRLVQILNRYSRQLENDRRSIPFSSACTIAIYADSYAEIAEGFEKNQNIDPLLEHILTKKGISKLPTTEPEMKQYAHAVFIAINQHLKPLEKERQKAQNAWNEECALGLKTGVCLGEIYY